MNLKEILDQDLKDSLKSKDIIKTSTLRLLKSNIKNKEIYLKKELNEEEIIQVLRQELKQRSESIKAYQEAKRDELREQEEKEFEIINKYLPALMSAEDIIKIVEEVKGSGLNDFGKIMKEVMIKTKGQAAGALVQKIVKDKLQIKK